MLDSTGFKRKQYSELLTEMEAKAKELFGADANTSERSFLGIILRIFAWFLSLLWQNSEDVYNSGYVNTAEGNNLARLGPYGGIQLIQERYATGTITITGTPGYTVPEAFRVSTGTGVFFETTAPVTLDGNGSGTVDILAVSPGRIGNVAAGTITTIVNPDANVTAVTNTAATTGGREKETDKEFRDRFAISNEGRGKATVPSIRAALLNTPGVRAATVIENYTSTVDGSGRPPKSFEAYVLGGEPEDIGSTILNSKAAGIEPYGTQSVTVKDDAGFDHVMKFSYAIEIETHLRFTITKDSRYPANGDAQLVSEAVRYVGGEDADGTLYAGLNMGDDVIHSRLIAAAYGVEGVTDVTVEISTDGSNWMEANISINANQVAQTSHQLIEVIVS